jgi:PiT family inorganic phosphate transporter
VQRLILHQENPLEKAKRFVPVYIFFAAFTITLVTILKGLSHVGLSLSIQESYTLAIAIAAAVAVIGAVIIARIQPNPKADKKEHFYTVERVFGVLMVITACGMAFAHGSNDVANAIGPLAAVIGVATTGSVAAKSSLPWWVLVLGGGGIVIGLALLLQQEPALAPISQILLNVIIGATVIHELIGPFTAKLAIIRSGEAQR